MRKFTSTHFFAIIIGLLFFSQAVIGQEKKPLTLDDYDQWNSIRNTSISPNGVWMSYSYAPNEGDSKLYIRKIEGDTLRTAINGRQVDFSMDNKWAAYLVAPSEKEAEKLKKQGKPTPSSLELLNLATNSVSSIDNASSYSFSKNSNYIAIQKPPSDRKAEHKGSDLILKNLNTDKSLNIGNVSSYAFNEKGNLFAYLVDADGTNGNGLYIIDLSNSRTWPLHTGAFSYNQMTWNEAGDQLAVLFGTKKEGNIELDNTLYWASKLSAGMSSLGNQSTYVAETDSNFPTDKVISEYSRLTWNEKNTQLYFGVKEQVKEHKKEDELKANVDVWHWKDERVQSVQMVQANRERRATFSSVLNLADKKFIQLENEDMPNVSYSEKSHWAVGQNNTKYRNDVTIPGNYADIYSINTRTGEHKLIAERLYWKLGLSPNGEWTVFSRNGEVFGYNFSSGSTTNLTAKAGVSFENKDYDSPVEKPSYGVAGWSNDGKWIVINNKYDLWAIALNSNEAKNLTQGLGDEEEIQFRLTQLDPEVKDYDLKKPLLLSAYGEWTKKSGYYTVDMGKKPKVLRYEDSMIGRPTKAKDANTLIYTEQTFVDFPDYWVADLSFKNPKKITDANPQQANYKWGKRVLVDYTDQRGNKLQATLALPADYQPGKKYPMVMYFYEKMSQRHHQYSMPTYDDRPHMSTYASNGYLVLMPDIVFDEGKPGSSALDDVTSAAKEVIKLGYADPERIGLQGHSWGGYESSFIVTQTDMFAAVVTGAPLTNLISMYNIAYKQSGSLNGPIIEWSQGRMGVSPWENMQLYQDQSPLFHAENIKTPFLLLHGTADGAVDWNQGLEFYSAARRLGKEVIMLSYPDEPHHLANRDNQKDFQIRMKQYFDHYLKDAPAPLWMTEGIPHLDKKKIGPEVMEEKKEKQASRCD
ncbi:S9 family peptidase [Roseivirga echinicomitans]